MPPTDSIEFHEEEDWTAVYLNGELQRVGDAYLANEWLQNYAGVKVVQDDAFMRGGDSRQEVAQTLDQIREYKRAKADRDNLATRLLLADALRREAQDLINQAEDIENGVIRP